MNLFKQIVLVTTYLVSIEKLFLLVKQLTFTKPINTQFMLADRVVSSRIFVAAAAARAEV